MKGLEWKTLMGIIILILLIVLVVSYFIGPVHGTGEESSYDIEFRFNCVLWSEQGYERTIIEREYDVDISMNESCTRVLKIDCPIPSEGCMPGDPNAPEWEQCRAACRLATVSGD